MKLNRGDWTFFDLFEEILQDSADEVIIRLKQLLIDDATTSTKEDLFDGLLNATKQEFNYRQLDK